MVLGVVILTFLMVRVLPGDPAVVYAGERATEAQLEQVREQFGLNQGLFQQLLGYVGDVLRGDLGVSISTRQPIADDLARALPASLGLSLVAMLVAVPGGILLGLVSVRFAGRALDCVIQVFSVLAISFPVFWLALLLQSVFASKLGWLPVAGQFSSRVEQSYPLASVTNVAIIDSLLTGNWAVLQSAGLHVVLPAVVIAAYPIGLIAQLTRGAVSEQMRLPHIAMARALGFGENELIGRFALRPALTPLIAVSGLVLASTLVNSALTEAVFNWPGLGSYIFAAIRAIDTAAVVGVTLVVGIAYVLINLLADLIQAAIDPRVSLV